MENSEEDDGSRDAALEIDEEMDPARYSPNKDFDSEYAPAEYSPARSPENYLISINNNRKVRERKSRDIRRVVRVAGGPILDPAKIPPMLPEQTEPEDLSLPKSKLRNQNNNHGEDESLARLSRSPSLENDSLISSLYHHPKFRRHIEITKTDAVW